ncbi:hypothetical protein SAMN04515691_1670 [Leifsonia sp. 98AMF]|uniref:hypothetical protein n=1 Tax=unclassified Leifsonia TaxID=2663824 RepID=UPI00087BD78A|nr:MULTISPECIES: hypothetical protein [unclassified Leifsonia]SDH39538.1 hypothetical protein SAMN04515690_2349 [Leifsonia sp. 197AMF]SDI96871.1 hypothetical protein SAMN04515684_1437 [Leifsonia sp. 466MF]SDJ78906.1 hypothetical protein SAMN04515683_1311 [Leifsonia sp. 157MF]SDO00163.1 hypothetical protein SAMN04515686_3640 [Leifsonia sp. 509MF]SEN04073.1 hypothetical protein SAMN04515685_1296 [Leifsonia sp. 467MF]
MSEKTVLQRFQAKPGDGIALVVAEDGDRALLGALPDGATEAPVASAAILATVVRTRDELLARYAEQLPVASGARAVWVVYPKGGRADVNRDVVAGEARAYGWRGVSNIAVDDTWSAVRVRPLKDGEE